MCVCEIAAFSSAEFVSLTSHEQYFVTNVLLIVLAVLAVVLGLAYMSSSDRPSSSPMEMSSTDSMQSAHRSNDGRQHHDGMLGGHHRKQHSGDRQHRFGHHNKPNNDNNAAVSNNNNAQPVAPASDFLPVNPPSQHGNSGGADAENGGAVQPGNGMMDLTPPATNTPSTDIEVTSMSTSMVVGCVIMFLFALIVFAFKVYTNIFALFFLCFRLPFTLLRFSSVVVSCVEHLVNFFCLCRFNLLFWLLRWARCSEVSHSPAARLFFCQHIHIFFSVCSYPYATTRSPC